MSELQTLSAHRDALMQLQRSLGIYVKGHPSKSAAHLVEARDLMRQAEALILKVQNKTGEQ